MKGAKRARWRKSDKEYANGGYKKEQSVSILGYGAGLDRTGKQQRAGPDSVLGAKVKFAKNYKAPNFKDLVKELDEKPEKKGLFGLW